jgi:hypothetical protein
MRESAGDGLPDFMRFLSWTELPWYWVGTEHFGWAMILVLSVPAIVALPNLEFINNLKFMMREVFINISQEPIEIILWITFGFVLILTFKNSMEKINSFKVNKKTVFLNILLFVFGVLSLNKVSEFLYFNF